MKLVSKIAIAIVTSAVLTGCVTTGSTTSVSSAHQTRQGVTSNSGSSAEAIKTVSCPSPVMSISVAGLQCNAASCRESANGPDQKFGALIQFAREQEGIPDLSGFGGGLTDMLQTALQNSGCFDVVDRRLMEELAEEYRLSGREMKFDSADALMSGAITSLSYEKSSSRLGGGFVPVLGGVSTSQTTAKIGMDLRIVDVNTGRVSYANTLNAESGRRNFGIAGVGLIGGGLIGGSHSVKGGIEMEEASRVLILDAVVDVVERLVPSEKYEVKYILPDA